MAKKILIVDDEADLLKTMKIHLESRGYDVVTAVNGNEGLDKVEKENPDLIVLDIMMPEMDGTEMAQRLRENPHSRKIPIIFLTCLVEKEESKFAGHIIGNNFFLAKPFDSQELIGLIDKQLNIGN